MNNDEPISDDENPSPSASPSGDEAARRDAAFLSQSPDQSVARGGRFASSGLPSGAMPQEDDDSEYSRVEADVAASENVVSESAPDENATDATSASFEERPEPSLADFAAGELVPGAPPQTVDDALEAQSAVPSDNYDAPILTTAPDTTVAPREYSQATEAQSAPAPAPNTSPSHDSELDVFAHLAELRTRILRSVAAVVVAMIATWQFRDALLGWFSAPMRAALEKHGGLLTTTSPTEGFAIYLQITFISAMIFTMPVVLYQIWAFIEPALTKTEKRYGGILVPFSVILFFSGAALGFWMSPLFFGFFLQFQPPGTASFWTFADTAIFMAKMLLAFGITFQVPVVTIFLNKMGLVSRNWLIEYWRHVVVVIFTVVAIVTPTWDPLSLCAAAVPPCLLYAVSIWLIKWL